MAKRSQLTINLGQHSPYLLTTYLLVVADIPLEEDIPQQRGAAHSPLEGAAKDILPVGGSPL